tara:strand:- start:59 stop:307 length:249 start_codon:yes stop_codon:yes gene_type:complete
MFGTISEYKDQAAYWAALCAMDGLEMSDEILDPNSADGKIDSVWEFVVENCKEEGITIPSKEEAIAELREMIAFHNIDMTEN